MPQNLKRVRIQTKGGKFTHVWKRAESKKKKGKAPKKEKPKAAPVVDNHVDNVKMKHQPQQQTKHGNPTAALARLKGTPKQIEEVDEIVDKIHSEEGASGTEFQRLLSIHNQLAEK